MSCHFATSSVLNYCIVLLDQKGPVQTMTPKLWLMVGSRGEDDEGDHPQLELDNRYPGIFFFCFSPVVQ